MYFYQIYQDAENIDILDEWFFRNFYKKEIALSDSTTRIY